MTDLPQHILEQLRQLIDEKVPIEEICFLMDLSQEIVEAEIERLNTTRADRK